MISVGVIFLAIGIAINVMDSRSRFYKRNKAGVEEYKSFGASVGQNFIAWLGGFLCVIGAVILLLGILAS